MTAGDGTTDLQVYVRLTCGCDGSHVVPAGTALPVAMRCRYHDSMTTEAGGVAFVALPWRTGRKVGRTIYAQLTADPLDSDPLIGLMDYPALASAVVAAHNASLAAVPVHQQED